MKLSEEIDLAEKRLLRLYNGCCPDHNTALHPKSVAFTKVKPNSGKLPRPYADIIGCSVKGCTYAEVIDNVNSPAGKARPRKQLHEIIASYKDKK